MKHLTQVNIPNTHPDRGHETKRKDGHQHRVVIMCHHHEGEADEIDQEADAQDPVSAVNITETGQEKHRGCLTEEEDRTEKAYFKS